MVVATTTDVLKDMDGNDESNTPTEDTTKPHNDGLADENTMMQQILRHAAKEDEGPTGRRPASGRRTPICEDTKCLAPTMAQPARERIRAPRREVLRVVAPVVRARALAGEVGHMAPVR